MKWIIKPLLCILLISAQCTGIFSQGKGEIKVSLRKDNREDIAGTVVLPGSLTGTFIWQDHIVNLIPGENTIQLNSK